MATRPEPSDTAYEEDMSPAEQLRLQKQREQESKAYNKSTTEPDSTSRPIPTLTPKTPAPTPPKDLAIPDQRNAVMQTMQQTKGYEKATGTGKKKGGTVKKMASGGSVSSASKRADGIAQRGHTKGRMV